MRLVEKGETRLYHDEITGRQLLIRFFLPIMLGGIIGISGILYVFFREFPMDAPLLFVILLGPVVAGFIIAITLLVRAVGKSSEYAVRGSTRSDLSIAITFLDMINEGEANLGGIDDVARPYEFNYIRQHGLRASLNVLNRIDTGMGSKWFKVVSQRLSHAFSFREKLFLRTTFFGTIITVMVGFALEFLRRFGFIDTLLAFYLIAGDLVIAIILVVALIVHVIRNRDSEPPERVTHALSEPEVGTETDFVLTRLFRVISEESKHPLRFLVLGSYDNLEYTGRTFTTSRNLTLREAVFLPKTSR